MDKTAFDYDIDSLKVTEEIMDCATYKQLVPVKVTIQPLYYSNSSIITSKSCYQPSYTTCVDYPTQTWNRT